MIVVSKKYKVCADIRGEGTSNTIHVTVYLRPNSMCLCEIIPWVLLTYRVGVHWGIARVCHFLTDNSLQSADKDQQEMCAVAEKPHDAVVKFDTYRNVQRQRTVLPAIARLLLQCKVWSRNSDGFPLSRASNKCGVGKPAIFWLMRLSQKRYEIRPKLLLVSDRKLHMRCRFAPRSMIRMTLDCCIFKFSRNFALLRILRRPIYWGCRALTFALARLSYLELFCTSEHLK